CRGNLTQFARAVEELVSQRRSRGNGEEWHRERAGSLRSLNQIAAGLGVQMLQDLVAERIQSSLWAHIECDDTGRFRISYPASGPEGNASCPLCAKAGEGDAGLRW